MNCLRINQNEKEIAERVDKSCFSIIFKPIISMLNEFYIGSDELSNSISYERNYDLIKKEGVITQGAKIDKQYDLDEVSKLSFLLDDMNSICFYKPGFIEKFCFSFSDNNEILVFFNDFNNAYKVDGFIKSKQRIKYYEDNLIGNISCIASNMDGLYWELFDVNRECLNPVTSYLNEIQIYRSKELPFEESFFFNNY